MVLNSDLINLLNNLYCVPDSICEPSSSMSWVSDSALLLILGVLPVNPDIYPESKKIKQN